MCVTMCLLEGKTDANNTCLYILAVHRSIRSSTAKTCCERLLSHDFSFITTRTRKEGEKRGLLGISGRRTVQSMYLVYH